MLDPELTALNLIPRRSKKVTQDGRHDDKFCIQQKLQQFYNNQVHVVSPPYQVHNLHVSLDPFQKQTPSSKRCWFLVMPQVAKSTFRVQRDPKQALNPKALSYPHMHTTLFPHRENSLPSTIARSFPPFMDDSVNTPCLSYSPQLQK